MAAAVKQVNAHAETMGSQAALFMNINAAKGLHEVMKTNLGPRGTIKMLVGGAGGESSNRKKERKKKLLKTLFFSFFFTLTNTSFPSKREIDTRSSKK